MTHSRDRPPTVRVYIHAEDVAELLASKGGAPVMLRGWLEKPPHAKTDKFVRVKRKVK